MNSAAIVLIDREIARLEMLATRSADRAEINEAAASRDRDDEQSFRAQADALRRAKKLL